MRSAWCTSDGYLHCKRREGEYAARCKQKARRVIREKIMGIRIGYTWSFESVRPKGGTSRQMKNKKILDICILW